MSVFKEAELRYLVGGQQLGRLATVGADGTPHVVPVGWIYNAARDTIDVGGHELALTKKFRDIERTGRVAIVIGDVRPEKANDVLEALFRAEVRGVSLSRVQGHGGELERVETYRGPTVKMGLSDKIRFEIAVSDAFVEPTIEALCEGARTGEGGDGKIFVVRLERAVRIRTGETDHSAVTPVDA